MTGTGESGGPGREESASGSTGAAGSSDRTGTGAVAGGPGVVVQPIGGAGGNAKTNAKGDRLPFPEQPFRTLLWIPAAVLLLPVLGGAAALTGYTWWWSLPMFAVAWCVGGGHLLAMASLCPRGVLRVMTVVMLLPLVFGLPFLAAAATQSTVLQARGTSRVGIVTSIDVEHGKTTTYDCTVRYLAAPAEHRKLRCSSDYRVGEQVTVVEDPEGWVGPAFSGSVLRASFRRTLLVVLEGVLAAFSALMGGVGILAHRLQARTPHLDFD